MEGRSPEQIRSSIESSRMELAVSVQRLRGEVDRLFDMRGHIERHREEITVGAVAVVGLIVTRGLLRRRRRRREG